MRNVYLHGYLGERYGESFRFAVDTPIQAVRLLQANFPGFMRDLHEGAYRVVRGDPEKGFHYGGDNLQLALGRHDLHIIPVPAGGKNSGIGKAILGAVIVVAAVALAPWTGGTSVAAAGGAFGQGAGMAAAASGFAAEAFLGLTYGNIALFGALLAVSGVTQMLSPQASVNSYADRESPEERPSFVFNGPVNNSEQGGIRPIVYGRMMVGSTVITGGLVVEQI